jgi:hypothetical protein
VDVDIVEVRRLGRKNDKADSKRPLMITFTNDWDQRKVFNSLNKLKGAAPTYKNLRITNDLSRDEIKKLITEAKNLTAQDSGENFFIVRNKEILKVKRRKQQATVSANQPTAEKAAGGAEDQPQPQTSRA